MENYFSIPKPCTEDWNTMDATEQGAFCSKCTKEVLDCSTVKTSEIKGLLAKKKNPCVRILKHQIDGLNLMEWYNSLSLKKQLKYLFLFVFLIVFKLNVKAQDYDTILSPIQPQFIALDSVDVLSPNEIETALNYEFIADLKTAEIEEYILTVDSEMGYNHPINSEEINIQSLGMIHWQPFIGNIAVEPRELKPLNTPLFDLKNELPLEIIATNYMILNRNKYTFFIEEDVLIFNTNASKDDYIQLKIIKKESGETVYFTPIKIPIGQRRIQFDLTRFTNGAYIIVMNGETNKKAIELMYW